ncbi:hypothetical protein [Desulfogranum mediterraneum]|uniref:hypothetical protein n=1 Tax=Desulfogranum mediterraneum TaxID=160661 RepID=UPI00041E475F|nr:hypothetical protein [Desulfogranum mediterraneum]
MKKKICDSREKKGFDFGRLLLLLQGDCGAGMVLDKRRAPQEIRRFGKHLLADLGFDEEGRPL